MNSPENKSDSLNLRIEAVRSRIVAVEKEQAEIAKELDEIEMLQKLEEKNEQNLVSQKYDDDVYKTIFDLEWGTIRIKKP